MRGAIHGLPVKPTKECEHSCLKGKQSDLERDCIVYCEVSHKSRFKSLEGLGKHIRDCSRVRGADTLINNIEEK